MVAGRFKDTSAFDLKELFAAADKSEQRDHLVFHFHGGLVGRESAHAVGEKLLEPYRAAHAWPVFVIWNSDLKTQLQEKLLNIAAENVFKHLLRRILRLAEGKLRGGFGERGAELEFLSLKDIPKEPWDLEEYAAAREAQLSAVQSLPSEAQMRMIEQELADDLALKKDAEAITLGLGSPEEVQRNLNVARAGAANSTVPVHTRMAQDVLDEFANEKVGAAGARGISASTVLAIRGAKAVLAVLRRFLTKSDHGLYTTVVEEILRSFYIGALGTRVWSEMKQDTVDAFGGDPAVHAGTAIMKHLRQWWQPGRRITLVGHSAGAIFCGNFLEALDDVLPPEAKTDLIFLAPACTFRFVNDRVTLLQRRVQAARVFALKDELESGYWEVPGLYKGSLLYMISGLFEGDSSDEPIVGMQRYYSGAKPYNGTSLTQVTSWLQNRVWSKTQNGPGWECAADEHGRFLQDESMVRSLGFLVKNGLGK